jgi:MFS family permease
LNGLLFFCSTLGNYLAPVAGGYIAISTQGWRWSFWYLAIFQGIISILLFFFLEETKYMPDDDTSIRVPDQHIPVISGVHVQDEKVSQKAAEAGYSDVRPVATPTAASQDSTRRRLVEIDNNIPIRPKSRRYAWYTTNGSNHPSHYSWVRHLYQPFVLLYQFPVVAFAAVQWAFCLSALSVVAVATSNIYPYPPYSFSAAGVGNLNIAPAVGSIIGIIWGGPVVDWAIVHLARRNKGVYEPEMRLTLFVLPGILMPVGVFMYGLCTANGMHWIIPTMGSALIGFSIGGVGDIALTYLQDSYEEILPDALIGVAFVRNIMATILVFTITPWFDGMGVYDAFVLLGCISVAFSLLGIPMYFYGKKVRVLKTEKYKYYAGKQFVIKR